MIHGRGICFLKRELSRAIHITAQAGFGESNVSRYLNGRPEYTNEVIVEVGRIIRESIEGNHSFPGLKKSDNLELSDMKILELGAGTGKFTSSLFRSEGNKGFEWLQRDRYFATEPSDAFRENISKLVPGVRVDKCTGDKITAESSSFAAIIVAQAFHWMADKKALYEIHRVLKPGQPLILIWNALDISKDLMYLLEYELLDEFYGDTEIETKEKVPRYLDGTWKDVFEEDWKNMEGGLFTPFIPWRRAFQALVPAQTIVDRILSVSVVAKRSDDVKALLEERVLWILRNHPDTKHITNNLYPLHYVNDVYTLYSI